MYSPADYMGNNGTEFEFIELKNIGSTAVDMSGLRIVDAVDFTFAPGTTIEPQAFFVIAANAALFQQKYERAPSGSWTVCQSFH